MLTISTEPLPVFSLFESAFTTAATFVRQRVVPDE
jgi:hypothetical protein